MPLASPNAHVVVDVIRFAGASGDMALVDPLIDLLGNSNETGRERRTQPNDTRRRQTVADVALDALRALTFQPIGLDQSAWRAWRRANPRATRGALLSAWLAERTPRVPQVPIWEMNRWMAELGTAADPQILPMVDSYLAREDLDAQATGPGSSGSSGFVPGGFGPSGANGPRVVTLLLEGALTGVPGFRPRLSACLRARDASVRAYGALAFSAFDRQAAIAHLARELDTTEEWSRRTVSGFLLRLGDARGIPALLDTLDDSTESPRVFGCRDLRVYTQQPLPCDPRADAGQRAREATQWRAWWRANQGAFRVPTFEAELDQAVGLRVSPVSFRPGKTYALRQE